MGKRGKAYIEAVIFDHDGTLVHLNIDFGLIRKGVEGIMAVYGIEPDGFRDLHILEMIDEATGLISEQNPSKGPCFYHESLELVAAHEVRAAKGGRILAGVIDMLRLLRRRRVKVGIITRNCKEAVRIVFPDIESLCDTFIPRDEVARVKPHPDHLALALKRLAVTDMARCLMVGDHVLDIEAGRRMGMKTAGVLTGRMTRRDFIEAGADFILDDATGVPGCIFEEGES